VVARVDEIGNATKGLVLFLLGHGASSYCASFLGPAFLLQCKEVSPSDRVLLFFPRLQGGLTQRAGHERELRLEGRLFFIKPRRRLRGPFRNGKRVQPSFFLRTSHYERLPDLRPKFSPPSPGEKRPTAGAFLFLSGGKTNTEVNAALRADSGSPPSFSYGREMEVSRCSFLSHPELTSRARMVANPLQANSPSQPVVHSGGGDRRPTLLFFLSSRLLPAVRKRAVLPFFFLVIRNYPPFFFFFSPLRRTGLDACRPLFTFKSGCIPSPPPGHLRLNQCPVFPPAQERCEPPFERFLTVSPLLQNGRERRLFFPFLPG